VGGSAWRATDVRVIAATNRDLAEEVRQGRFREDLFHRLAVVRVRLPPLRERKEDIPLLVTHLLSRAAEASGLMQLQQTTGGASGVPTTIDVPLGAAIVPPETMALLMNHDWPGNVRELKNVLDRGLSLLLPPPGDGPAGTTGGPPVLTPELLGLGAGALGAPPAPATNFHEAKEQLVSAWERDFVQALLKRAGGNVSRAAREAGIDRVYLHRLMKKHGIASASAAAEL
jgi:DNA-binding NtrC family response regulator